MRKLWAVVTILALISAVLPVRSNDSSSLDIYAKAYKEVHRIVEETIADEDHCSSTAVGPYALLTASHCELPTDVINVDGEAAHILGIVRDDNDHTIYLLDREFDVWAEPSDNLPQMGEDVFLIGNPGEWRDVLRKGYVATIAGSQPTRILVDMNGWLGDSGAAFFDSTGKILGVMGFGVRQAREGNPWSIVLCGGYQLGFSVDQWKEAREFKPKK